MVNIVIINLTYGHLEIMESIIHKYKEIIGQHIPSSNISLFLVLKDDIDISFKSYIKSKYPRILFYRPKDIDYIINVNFYPKPKNLEGLSKLDPKRNFFISHRVFEEREHYPNIFFLTPLALKNVISANILPFSNQEKITTDIPIYAIQGHFSIIRRDYNLLKIILKSKFDYQYKIKLIGRGEIPKMAIANPDKFIVCQNKDFYDFHQEFNDCYAIFTLLSRKRNKKYYKSSLTSTINYAEAYNLKCIIDKELQDIYKLSNAQVYHKPRDIVHAFERTLKYFYSKKKKRLLENQFNLSINPV